MDGNSVLGALFEHAPVGLRPSGTRSSATARSTRGWPRSTGSRRPTTSAARPSELLGELGAQAEAALRRVLETGDGGRRDGLHGRDAGRARRPPALARELLPRARRASARVVVDVTERQRGRRARARGARGGRDRAGQGRGARPREHRARLLDAHRRACSPGWSTRSCPRWPTSAPSTSRRRRAVDRRSPSRHADPAAETARPRARPSCQAADRRRPGRPGRRRPHRPAARSTPTITPEDLDARGRRPGASARCWRELGIRSAAILPLSRARRGARRAHARDGHASGRALQRPTCRAGREPRRRRRAGARQRPPVRRAGGGRRGAAAHAAARRAARDPRRRGSPPATAPPGAATRSAATSTTSSTRATASGRS